MAKAKGNKKAAVVAANEVPKDRVTKAVEQLTKYVQKQVEQEESKGNDLLGGDIEDLDQNVSLIAVNANSFSGNTKQFKLKLVDISHSLYKPWKQQSATALKDFKCLVILRDQDIDKITEDELFDALHDDDITVDEIVSVKTLKTTYKAFEARRAFIQQFSLILADDSVVTALPKLIGGKAFNKIETTPIGIKTHSSSKKQFSKETLINSIKKIFNNKLPIKLPRGTTLNAHLGQLNWFPANDLVENIEAITKFLIDHYKIRSIFLKTNKSPVLPLYYNEKVIDELLSSKKDKSTTDLENNKKEKITIDGVEVELSTFEKSLLEIANPKDYSSIFSKNIKDAKRSREDDEDEGETTKKSKK